MKTEEEFTEYLSNVVFLTKNNIVFTDEYPKDTLVRSDAMAGLVEDVKRFGTKEALRRGRA